MARTRVVQLIALSTTISADAVALILCLCASVVPLHVCRSPVQSRLAGRDDTRAGGARGGARAVFSWRGAIRNICNLHRD